MQEAKVVFEGVSREFSGNAIQIATWILYWGRLLAEKLSPDNADNEARLHVGKIRVETVAPWLYHFSVEIRTKRERKMDLEFSLCDALFLSQDDAGDPFDGKWELAGLKVRPATSQELVALDRPRLEELGMCHEEWPFSVLPDTPYQGVMRVVENTNDWRLFLSCQDSKAAWIEKRFTNFEQFASAAKEYLEIAILRSNLREKVFLAGHSKEAQKA